MTSLTFGIFCGNLCSPKGEYTPARSEVVNKQDVPDTCGDTAEAGADDDDLHGSVFVDGEVSKSVWF